MGIVTISRGSFAGGKAVAEQLAQSLGWPLLGREEVLQQTASQYGIAESRLASALDSPPPFWEQMLGRRLAYVKCVTAVLLDHAGQGNLVYHGYVGHLLLAGVGHVLRVRVIADMEKRLAAAMQQGGLSRDQATAHIQRVDQDRSRWARALYGVNWESPELYDLVVNLQQVTPDSACAVIRRALEMPEFQPTAQSRRDLENLSLSCRVWAALASEPQTRSAGLHVAADDGQVVITGSVGSGKAADAVPRLAQAVKGVRSLRCEVGVGSDWYW